MTDKAPAENSPEFGLKGRALSLITDIFKNHPDVEEALLYGSRAKGTYKPGSDIDIVLKGKNLDLKELNRIILKLEELDLPYTFDVSIYHRIQDPELINHIKRVGKTLYTRK